MVQLLQGRRRRPPGLWRLVFPADPEAKEEDLLADDFVQNQMQKFFKRDEDYDIVHRNLYNVHQRVAATFRKGRSCWPAIPHTSTIRSAAWG